MFGIQIWSVSNLPPPFAGHKSDRREKVPLTLRVYIHDVTSQKEFTSKFVFVACVIAPLIKRKKGAYEAA
jgi:hypothetical protein